MKKPFLLAFLVLLCTRLGAQTPQTSVSWVRIAERIVQQLQLGRDEKVLLIAHPGTAEQLIPLLRYSIRQAGAVDLGVIDVLAKPVPLNWDLATIQEAEARARPVLKELLQQVDAAVMLPGASPSDAPYGAIQDNLAEGVGRVIHFHWAEGSAFPLPGQPLPPGHVVALTYQRSLLETDYAALGRHQRAFEQALRGAQVRVTSPPGTDLTFRVGERPVNRQDGDASRQRMAQARILIDREIELPAGAIRVAPLEETVNGVIAFPASQWNGRPVEGLRLRFERGTVVDVTASSGVEHARAEMESNGEAGRSLREFGLGFNPTLAVPEVNPWIPYYGYGDGVVRLSLGDNSELGGSVKGGYVRWNFFVDATVEVGDQVWVKDGKLQR